jgi:hypothetical protein
MSSEHLIDQLCGGLGVLRSGYYQWRRGASARARHNEEIICKIYAPHVWESMGERDAAGATRAGGAQSSRPVDEAAGFEGWQRRRYKVRTTHSRYEEPIAPNRLAEASAPANPDEVWGWGITYVKASKGRL